MKSHYLLLSFGVVSLLLLSRCTSTSEEPAAGTMTYDSLQTAYQQLVEEHEYLREQLEQESYRADSVSSLYLSLQESTQEEALAAEEKAFVNLMAQLNNEISTMIQTKEVQPVLDYFHNRFTSNVVQISLANQVDVERRNSATLPEYLNYLANDANISSLKFSVRDVLEVDVRNDQLGILVFTNDYEVRKDNGEVIRGEDLVQVVAKKYDSGWEIGNYSAILLTDYDKLLASQ